MLTTSFLIAHACLIATLSFLWLSHRITTKTHTGWMAILNAVSGVLSAVNGWTTTLYLSAGCAAWFAWMWWHSGGGDGTRRRLKRWAGRFQGVRRTAPQGA